MKSPPELSVIVPVPRPGLRLTRACLDSVAAHTARPHEVLVVEGAPSFSAAANRGLRAARGRMLVLLNNDARVGPGWSEGLAAALGAPGVGAAGPRTARPARDFRRLSAAWALARAGRTTPAARLYGHCLALRREAVEAVGLFDERLVWGEEDDDYCFRLRQAGWRLVVAEGVLVEHAGGATRSRLGAARRAALRRANAAVLREKWVAEAARIRRDLAEVLR